MGIALEIGCANCGWGLSPREVENTVARKEWVLENKLLYAFLHTPLENWGRLNELWNRNDTAKQWEKRFKKIWDSDLTTTGKTFLRQVLKNALLIGMRARRIGKEDGICGYCNQGLKSVRHIFFNCPKAILSWNGTTNFHDPESSGLTVLAARDLIDMVDGALPTRPMSVALLFLIHQMLWELWLVRNRMVFQKQFIRFSTAKIIILAAE